MTNPLTPERLDAIKARCDQQRNDCLDKCGEPQNCTCGLNTGTTFEAVCGHLVCEDCSILCEVCHEETICPGCVVRDNENNKCCGGECQSASNKKILTESMTAYMTNFVEKLPFEDLLIWAQLYRVEQHSARWLDDEWPDKEDGLRGDVIDAMVEVWGK